MCCWYSLMLKMGHLTKVVQGSFIFPHSIKRKKTLSLNRDQHKEYNFTVQIYQEPDEDKYDTAEGSILEAEAMVPKDMHLH